MKKFDILTTGELLTDFIGHKLQEDLEQSSHFEKYQGGSPANLAANIQKLGGQAAVVATVGNDGLGRFLINELEKHGVYTGYVFQHEQQPTSIIMIARTLHTPEFVPYRYADCFIEADNFPNPLLQQIKVFHTTAFGLSRNPAREAILDAAGRAHNFGARLSIDMNYAVEVFPERDLALDTLRRYFQYEPLIKISGDDAFRLYGRDGHNPKLIINKLLNQGARLVCFTDGAGGNYLATQEQPKPIFYRADKIEVKDSTGAGDAFWGGFLYAWLQELPLQDCQDMASAVVNLKLSNVGPLPSHLDAAALLQQYQNTVKS